MSKIQVTNQTDPATPDSGKTDIFVDSTTKLIKSIDDAGVVTAYAASAGASQPNPVDVSWKMGFEEFSLRTGDTFTGDLGLEGLVNGTGSSIVQLTNADTNRLGVYNFRSGTSAGSYVSACSNLNTLFGGADHRFGCAVKMTNTPTAGDDFRLVMGFNNSTSALGSNNCAILVDRSVSTTNFVTSTEAGGTQTTNDSGIALDTSWHNFEIIINAAGTSVGFYIDGTLVATHTTNIPTAAMHCSYIVEEITQTATRDTQIDWMLHAFKPSTARGTITTWIS